MPMWLHPTTRTQAETLMGALIWFGICMAVVWDTWQGDSWFWLIVAVVNLLVHTLASILVHLEAYPADIRNAEGWFGAYIVTSAFAVVLGFSL